MVLSCKASYYKPKHRHRGTDGGKEALLECAKQVSCVQKFNAHPTVFWEPKFEDWEFRGVTSVFA